jgi:hypothetical protein
MCARRQAGSRTASARPLEPMLRSRLCLCLFLGLLSCVSCGDDERPGGGEAGASDQPTAGKQSRGGSGGGAGEAGSLGFAGSAGSAGSAGRAGAACEGDADAWSAIIAAPVGCDTDEDCCVVVNPCLAEAQVVHADAFGVAQAAWPYCEEDCTDCIAPAIIVACDNGQCVGSVALDGEEQGASHCGDTAPLGDDLGRTFTCR